MADTDTVARRYRYPLRPTTRQAAALHATIDACHKTYASAITHLAASPDAGYEALSRGLVTAQHRDVAAVPRQQAVLDACEAWRQYRRGTSDKPSGRRTRRSARWVGPAVRVLGRGDGSDGGRVKLSRIGPVSVRWSRPLPNPPTSATVVHELGKWWVSFVVQVPVTILGPAKHQACGVDVGLSTLATVVSDAGTIVKVPSLHRHTTPTQRREHHRALACRLVRDHAVVVVEALTMAPMLTGPRGPAIRHQGWDILLRRIVEVAELYSDRSAVAVDPTNTSRICTGCGADGGHLGLARRQPTCADCGLTQDRDVRAATNILRRGVGLTLAGLTPAEAAYRRVDQAA